MSRFQRRHSFRNPKKFFIIATEGECTEEIYFSALKPSREAAYQLKILPANKGQSHPKQVLKRLRKYAAEAGLSRQDELWLVIDRDQWTEEHLNEVANEIAKSPRYQMALSNPCFELWLVLHRRNVTGVDAGGLAHILKQELGKYEKNDYDAPKLLEKVADAVHRAGQMDANSEYPWPRIYGTRVYQLVSKISPGLSNE